MRTTSIARGFSLVELLVSIAVVGILVGLAAPAVQHSREAARRAQCQNNLKQIALALHSYHDRSCSFPPSTVVNANGQGWWSWIVRILPELDQPSLYGQLDLREDVWANCHKYKPYTSQRLAVLVCPSDPHGGQTYESDIECPGGAAYALTNYLGCRGSTRGLSDADDHYPGKFVGNGIFPGVNRKVRLVDVIDGTSKTILGGERPADPTAYYGWWATGMGFDDLGLGDYVLDVYEGLDVGDSSDDADLLHYWSRHPGGAQFAMCDGAVRFVSYAIDDTTLFALGSRDGGEVVTDY